MVTARRDRRGRDLRRRSADAERERLCARRGRHRARCPASTRRTRATSARCSRCSRAASSRSSSSTGSRASSASATPGDIFGEVPIALGTVFPVGFRAAERSRVMRIEPHDYHAVASVAPDVGKEVGALAATGSAARAACRASPPTRPRRARSSSGIAGTRRAPSCGTSSTATRSRFTWLTPDAPDARRALGRPAAGRRGPARRSASSTARPWSGRSCAAWPSCSASPPRPTRPSTTR